MTLCKSLKSKKLLLIAGSMMLLYSCSNLEKTKNLNQKVEIKENETVKNLSAKVQVFERSSLNENKSVLQTEYKMYIENTEGNQLIRLDFENYNTSVVTDGNTIALLDSKSERMISRSVTSEVIDEKQQMLSKLMSGYNFGRVNMALARSAIQNFKVCEDAELNEMSVELPAEYFENETEKRISTKIIFNTKESILKKTETLTEQSDGGLLSVVAVPEYEELINGEYIKVGMKSYIEYTNPNNPDRNYTTQVQEVYSDIKVNECDDSVFRAIK